ncbi:hypothetical protein LXT21_02395 [Myxococcus sp. K38C18041901]|uniref:hypothetical protein n=1 Tax=Myxococcus guangdongensis TaxID=2906760 RepID=UPI0020A76A8C|nr:hypothetical protein [Myxococcus guangdongensis]MCP3057622.1 hypothetical protein [Myxococcus guangdongensis]
MRGILGGLLAAALLMGCGGSEADTDTPPPETQGGGVTASALCTSAYLTKYYNKTYTEVLGTLTCVCGAAPVFEGNLTPYPKTYNQSACP